MPAVKKKKKKRESMHIGVWVSVCLYTCVWYGVYLTCVWYMLGTWCVS